MPQTMIRHDADRNGHRVQITSGRLEEGFLSVKFSDEGMIIDHVDDHGSVIASKCQMYDEVVETLEVR